MHTGSQPNFPGIRHRPCAVKRMASAMLYLLLCSLTFHTSQASGATATANTQTDDVRVLIDISGSMKRTDPQNLRAPALRLFASLLPDGAQAGVWTFGQWVNMLIEHGNVNAQWKAEARERSTKINSLGLRTNLEEAIKRATHDWKQADPQQRRSLIILTDGLVDVDKDPQLNSDSRQRILVEQLPRLQQAEAVIHTIALSQESDRDLLKQLSSATGGWFETIGDSAGLERLFLRMFEKVSQPDTLPLKNNTVSIDGSIKEATFLIFRGDKSQPSSIKTPSGKVFSQSQTVDGVKWHSEDRYDLVTVENPETGPWHINAELDPDNRVMVVTDLRMKTTKLPNTVAAGESQQFTVHLEDAGKIIDRKDFLKFVRVSIDQSTENNQQWKLKLKDNGKGGDKTADDGIYSIALDETLLPGKHEIEISVNGTTFKRNSRQSFHVIKDPVDARIEKNENNIIISVVPYKDIIDSNAMRATVMHKAPTGKETEIRIPRINPAEWRLEMDEKNNPGQHQLTIHIMGNRPDGAPVDTLLKPVKVVIGDKDTAIKPIENSEEKGGHSPSKQENIAPGDKSEPEVNWLMIGLRILVFNILLIIVIFGIIKLRPLILKKLAANPAESQKDD